jgi:hypothetical protein
MVEASDTDRSRLRRRIRAEGRIQQVTQLVELIG